VEVAVAEGHQDRPALIRCRHQDVEPKWESESIVVRYTGRGSRGREHSAARRLERNSVACWSGQRDPSPSSHSPHSTASVRSTYNDDAWYQRPAHKREATT